MPTKEKLLQKLFQKRLPRNFTKQDLSALLAQCGCRKGQGGRGSGIRFFHEKSECPNLSRLAPCGNRIAPAMHSNPAW